MDVSEFFFENISHIDRLETTDLLAVITIVGSLSKRIPIAFSFSITVSSTCNFVTHFPALLHYLPLTRADTIAFVHSFGQSIKLPHHFRRDQRMQRRKIW